MQIILKNKFNILIFILFIIAGFAGVLHHELWRDEAQVWLVVRDLNIFGVVDHVRNEGHPLLWYMLVFPFAKLNLPVISMQILSFIFMSAAAGVFLWKSPFSKITRVCFIFSAGFLYWLTVISRSYSLVPLFLFLLAVYYPRQKENPYIYSILNILLANTHILMFGFSGAVCILFGYENISKTSENRKKYLAPFLINIVCLVITAVYILSRPEDNVSATVAPLSTISFETVKSSLTGFFTNIYAESLINAWVGAICIIAGLVWLFVRDKRLFAIFGFSTLYQFYIYICVCKASPEKAFLVLLTLVFCFWIVFEEKVLQQSEKIFVNSLIAVIFVLSWNLGFHLYKNDFFYKYSGSKEAAQYIQNNIEKDAVIISNMTLTTAGVLAYLPGRKFYVTAFNDYYTYGYKKFKMKEAQTFENKKVYYIYSALEKPDKDKIVLFVSSEDTLIPTEVFYIAKDK